MMSSNNLGVRELQMTLLEEFASKKEPYEPVPQENTVLYSVIKELLEIAENKAALKINFLELVFSNKASNAALEAQEAAHALRQLESFQPTKPQFVFLFQSDRIKEIMKSVLPTDGGVKSLGRRIDTYRGVQALLLHSNGNNLSSSMFDGDVPKTAIHSQNFR